MGLLASSKKPKVKSLARRGDIDGLIDAAFYQETTPAGAGATTDLGVPVRAEAVRALATAGPEAAALAVVDALKDSSDLVRSAAVCVLARWGEALPLARAAAWLPAGSGRARQLAMIALARLAVPRTASALAHALVYAVDDEPLRGSEAQLVTQLCAVEEAQDVLEEVVEVLVAALGDEREMVAERAGDLLARLPPASAQAIIAALSSVTSTHALFVLGRIGDPGALEPLLRALEHDDTRIRSASCSALGDLRNPAAVEALVSALNDPEPAVRASAGAALDQIGNAAIILGVSALLRPVIEESIRTSGRQRDATATSRRRKATQTAASGRAGGPNRRKPPGESS
jgi:HEAT repeat protein